MKHPKNFTLNGNLYIFHAEIYKDCYEYRFYYTHKYTGTLRFFNKFIEKGNLLYELYQKHLNKEKIYNDIQFTD